MLSRRAAVWRYCRRRRRTSAKRRGGELALAKVNWPCESHHQEAPNFGPKWGAGRKIMKTLCYMYLLCYMLFYMQGPFISMTISTAREVDASALILVRILELEILPSLNLEYSEIWALGNSICTLCHDISAVMGKTDKTTVLPRICKKELGRRQRQRRGFTDLKLICRRY